MTIIQNNSYFRRRRDYNQEETLELKIDISCEEINKENLFKGGYTVEDLNGTNTLINYLIKRRLSSNSSGFSSHIAAFVPKIGSKKQCLLRRKGKHRYRRKL
jgi:hypothetical protein